MTHHIIKLLKNSQRRKPTAARDKRRYLEGDKIKKFTDIRNKASQKMTEMSDIFNVLT